MARARSHLTQCGLGGGLYLRTKWHLDLSSRLVTTDMGRKLGSCVPLGEGELGLRLTQSTRAEAYLRAKFHLDPSNHLSTIHQRYRQDRQTDRTMVR